MPFCRRRIETFEQCVIYSLCWWVRILISEASSLSTQCNYQIQEFTWEKRESHNDFTLTRSYHCSLISLLFRVNVTNCVHSNFDRSMTLQFAELVWRGLQKWKGQCVDGVHVSKDHELCISISKHPNFKAPPFKIFRFVIPKLMSRLPELS